MCYYSRHCNSVMLHSGNEAIALFPSPHLLGCTKTVMQLNEAMGKQRNVYFTYQSNCGESDASVNPQPSNFLSNRK